MTIALVRDENHLYTAGYALLPALNNVSDVQSGMHEAETVFGPALQALNNDSLTDAAVQQRVADAAAARSRVAYIGSLVIGLALLVLLGLQLYRIRRRSLLIEERRSTQRRTEQRVRALVEHSSDIITVVGPELTIRWQSNSVQRQLGLHADTLPGTRLTALCIQMTLRSWRSTARLRRAGRGPSCFTARFGHSDGGWRHMEVIADNRLADPAIEGVVLSMRDISERKALEDELRHQAFHDSLTGLANRALFEDRLVRGLPAARRRGHPVAVLFLDLDDFKTINDSIGHASGDELLRAAATRIARTVRATDTAARLGGDEFAVLLDVIDDPGDPERIATRLLEEMQPPFQIGERELRDRASIGLAFSDGSIGVDELLRNADTAMYAAKESGKGTMQTFEEDMHTRVLERLELTAELQQALKHDEFELDYQPIVDLRNSSVVGCEALVRWAHPTRGRLAPAQFISLAEQSGLIVPLGGWILTQACYKPRSGATSSPGAASTSVSTSQPASCTIRRSRGPSAGRVGSAALDPDRSCSRSPRACCPTTMRSSDGCMNSKRWDCVWRSTTSGPATPHSHACRPTLSTSSRSTARSSAGSTWTR